MFIYITVQDDMRIYKKILLPLSLIVILTISPFIGINPLVTTAATAQENSASDSASNSTNSNIADISVNS